MASQVNALYIVNKHGSLLYQIDATPSQVSSNDKIRVASIFHSVCAIAAQISPNKASMNSELSFLQSKGIEVVLTSRFSMYSKQTLTGLKLMIIVSPSFSSHAAHDLLLLIYANYSDFVLKNPFYALDMPIRCSLFDKAVKQILAIDQTSFETTGVH